MSTLINIKVWACDPAGNSDDSGFTCAGNSHCVSDTFQLAVNTGDDTAADDDAASGNADDDGFIAGLNTAEFVGLLGGVMFIIGTGVSIWDQCCKKAAGSDTSGSRLKCCPRLFRNPSEQGHASNLPRTGAVEMSLSNNALSPQQAPGSHA